MSELTVGTTVEAAPANVFGKFGDAFSGGKRRKNKRTNKRTKGGESIDDFMKELPADTPTQLQGGKKRQSKKNKSKKNKSKRRKTHRK